LNPALTTQEEQKHARCYYAIKAILCMNVCLLCMLPVMQASPRDFDLYPRFSSQNALFVYNIHVSAKIRYYTAYKVLMVNAGSL
jgi:hypothetical protein